MPQDRRPAKLQQVAARPCVAEDPVVVPGLVEFAPVTLLLPGSRLATMPVVDVTDLASEHPVIQLPKERRRDHRSVVVGPAPDDGVQLVENGLDRRALASPPDVPSLLSLGLDRFLARR